ncbi:unnamed protein product [Adineta ricciae]|uniref:G-protein coupled receptors family 1 profile domain-containing protein n=1 Tax=Adineta ricciae TaxID=249248 RepID=A0A814XDK8_ADIRI|nr:unnamed protein product [Adineta ricciae]CAF1370493.1 unnamed protein product [Adineta ricciae]
MSLINIGKQITIYVGWSLLAIGIVGNGINIFIFSSVQNYRQTPCTFYFLISSIDNLLILFVNLLSRILILGYEIDLTKTSLFWCKFRSYTINVFPLSSFSYSCLSSIDQYLLTSRNVQIRRLSQIKYSYRIVFFLTLFWFIHAIPQILFFDNSSQQTCSNTNPSYSIYNTIYILTFSSTFPILIMIIFGYFTYCNIQLIRTLNEHQIDYQLLRMTLFQIILILITVGPYGINHLYELIQSFVNKNKSENESLISTIFSLLYYVNFSGNCYMFLICSRRFRRQVKHRLFFFRYKQNQINPTQ